MDNLDIRILRSLMMGGGTFFGSDVRRPYKMISNRLSVSEDTVRNRVDRLHAEGFIRGWKLGINPTFFGLRASYLFFDVRPPPPKQEVIRKIRLMPGVTLILGYYGNFLGVHVTYESDSALKKKTELISRTANSDSLVSTKLSFPPCAVRPTQTDLTLLKILRGDPRKPLGLVAGEAGVSPRTAKRRIRRLVQGGAVYTLPEIDVKALKGGVASSLSVFYADADSARKTLASIKSRYDEYLLIFHAADNEYGWFGFIVPNIPTANEIDEWVKGLEGVQSTSMRLVEDFVNMVDEAFEEELERNISIGVPEIRSS